MMSVLNNFLRLIILSSALTMTGSFVYAAPANPLQETTDTFGVFGTVHIYRPASLPSHVVLFISGDGGWNLGVVDMARELASLDSMVVGIDITHYIAELNKRDQKCSYGAADFEGLSQYLQKKYDFPHYLPPMLVGYSSGATMVYTLLAQAPINTFAGGISMGFCPDLKTANPFCKGNGTLTETVDKNLGFIYQKVDSVPSPWVVLQGDIDQVCSTPDTKMFVQDINNAELTELPKVGHGFSVPRNWMPQFRDAFHHINGIQVAATKANGLDISISDLPLIEMPLADKPGKLAIIISGDGGWATLDKQVAEAMNAEGIPVVGLNSLQYFWGNKDPDSASKDLERILTFYGKNWNAGKFILIGYSQGADVLPFMISRLPDELKQRIDKVALLGLEEHVDFEFHMSNWLSSADSGHYDVIAETKQLKGMTITCIYGDEETDSACHKLDKAVAMTVEMKGGHHFGGKYQQLARIILGTEQPPVAEPAGATP